MDPGVILRALSHPWFGPVRDAGAVYVAVAAIFAVSDAYRPWEVFTLAAIAAALQVGWCVAADVYDTSHPRVARPPFTHLARGLTWVLLTYLATHFVTNGEPERRTIVFAWSATVAAMAATYTLRAAVLVTLQRRGAFRERLLIVGGNLQAESVAEQIEAQRTHALELVGVLDEFSARSSQIGPVRVLGDPLELEAVVDRHGVTSVMVVATAVSWEAQEHVMQVAAHRPGLRVFMVAGIHDLLSSEVVPAQDGMPSLVRLRPAQLRRRDAVLKRALDVTVALLLLPLLAAVLAVAWIGGGRPLTRTVEVVGRGGRTVRMRLLAPGRPGGRLRAHLAAGRARKLAALISVLRGDLSIVGPRPIPAAPAGEHAPRRGRLLLMPPGLTGPWDRDRAGVDSGLLDDLAYIRTYTIWADLRLLLMSLRRALMRESAVPATRDLPGTPAVGDR